eukprot:scaffold1727_cov133-Cylindrotheca_fusiformis.AAC.40
MCFAISLDDIHSWQLRRRIFLGLLTAKGHKKSTYSTVCSVCDSCSTTDRKHIRKKGSKKTCKMALANGSIGNVATAIVLVKKSQVFQGNTKT